LSGGGKTPINLGRVVDSTPVPPKKKLADPEGIGQGELLQTHNNLQQEGGGGNFFCKRRCGGYNQKKNNAPKRKAG